jgi:hypothetical protein
MGRTKILKDYEEVVVKNGELFRFSCCDCGKAHDVVICTEGGKEEIHFSMRENRRSTSARRRSPDARRAIKKRILGPVAWGKWVVRG